MATRASDLVEPRHIERLRVEIVEVISTALAYPPFFDVRTEKLRTRPIDRAKVAEIEQFIGSANFTPIEQASPSSPDTRRFIERLILRYLEVNPSLTTPSGIRYLPIMRSQASRLAAETHRRFIAYLNGIEREFGSRKQAASWASIKRGGRHSHSDGDHNSRLLEAALRKPEHGAPSGAKPQASKSAPADATVPSSAIIGPHSLPGSVPVAPFEAIKANAHPGVPNIPADLADQPTGPLAVVTPPRASNGERTPMRELPPDLINLYGAYLGDLEPDAPVSSRPALEPHPQQPAPIHMPAAPQPPPHPIASSLPASSTTPATSPADARGDQLIFWQLRYQLEAYVRLAARSYGLPGHGGDPASVLDELRRSGFVDEADLRIAEGVFALTDRVTAQGHATTADYRQALMLYLLYHRSHINA
jgi:hypothetical protein